VPQLAAAALARWNERVEPHRRVPGISDEAIVVMQAYDWPGNVRELMAAVEYACIVCDGKRILACHLPEEVREGPQPAANPNGGDARKAESRAEPRRYQAPDANAEREAIRSALEEASGNRTKAAAALGMGRTTLWQKLKEYGLDRGE
jgi:DNA-binding NtrC family response regulator